MSFLTGQEWTYIFKHFTCKVGVINFHEIMSLDKNLVSKVNKEKKKIFFEKNIFFIFFLNFFFLFFKLLKVLGPGRKTSKCVML